MSETETPQENVATHDPKRPSKLLEFMSTGWAERDRELPAEAQASAYRRERRARLIAQYPGEVLVVPSGGFKVRANDTDFRFRPGSDFTWLVGSREPDAVLVIDAAGEAVLYQAPAWTRETPAFFTDRNGEFWVGPRPSLDAVAAELGITTRPLEEIEKLRGTVARVLTGYDAKVEELFDNGADQDKELATWLSEARLVKDDWEVAQLQLAVDATIKGFEDVAREMPKAVATSERWAEGVFGLRARVEGNDVGYGSICAAGSHACVLHWTDNDGPVRDGELILLDMGVEGHELYTADVTRTLPVSGSWTPRQREMYDLVYRSQEAALAECKPGNAFLAPHNAAMKVLAEGLEALGIVASAEEVLDQDDKRYSRWTIHGVSHMLGLDVHDCAASRNELYRDGTLQVGHVLTVEPGLYFQADDLLVPEDLRGIGIRIEDDVLITAEGHRNLSAALPRDPDGIERWMASLR
ncbi:MAG: Xaa-Pro aminopeptidase [Frankiales bacterium]|nr:Xaa-Pro aminopeptidase [Frankiales bacterium]